MGAMSRKQKKESSQSPEWWTVGAPCAIVVSMLLLSAVLSGAPTSQATSQAIPERPAETIDLQQRAADDAARLADDSTRWTLQFMMACDENNLRPLVASLEGEGQFFLLPYPDATRDCYRVFWGLYRSKQEAQRPRVYPPALRSLETTPWPIPLADVLP